MRNERQRLILGPDPEEKPGALGLMRVRLTCVYLSESVLARIRESLSMVFHSAELAAQSHGPSDAEAFPQRPWREETLDRLERWYSAQFMADLDEGPGREYLGQLFSERDWEWWSANIVDGQTIDIEIRVLGFPISGFDALRWHCQSCGASEVKQLRG
ncbi:MAG: hypothetical protein P1V97_08935 [Planctomycetota bacterium]|nr:hypothetical protein [Planctomycetota bacterium]